MNNVFNLDTYLNTSIWVAPNWVASCWDVISRSDLHYHTSGRTKCNFVLKDNKFTLYS